MLFYSQNRSEKFGDHVWFHITSELISLYLPFDVSDFRLGCWTGNAKLSVACWNYIKFKVIEVRSDKSVKEVPKNLKINSYLSGNQ